MSPRSRSRSPACGNRPCLSRTTRSGGYRFRLAATARSASRRTPGFTAEVKNNTGFIITEITFGISIDGGPAEMYRVDDFRYQEPGVIYTGLPPDPTVEMRIDSLKSKKFQFALDRPEIDKKKKWNWYVVGAKGIVSK